MTSAISLLTSICNFILFTQRKKIHDTGKDKFQKAQEGHPQHHHDFNEVGMDVITSDLYSQEKADIKL